MDVRELLEDLLSRVHEHVHETAEGLSPDQLAREVEPGSNSIAWELWHLTRVADSHMAELVEHDQLWATGDWATRFGLEPDPENSGYGHSREEMAAVRPDGPGAITDYFDAVEEVVLGYVATVDAGALDRVVDLRWDPPVTLGVRLVSIVDDQIQHAGHAAYVRGILERR